MQKVVAIQSLTRLQFILLSYITMSANAKNKCDEAVFYCEERHIKQNAKKLVPR